MKAMQFDGTLGSAKAIAAWIGDPALVVAGPGFLIENGAPDDHPGGVDLIGTDENGAPHYRTANATDFVVKSGDGYVIFSAEQFAAAFPEG